MQTTFQVFINEVVAKKLDWTSDFGAKRAKIACPTEKTQKSTFFLMGVEQKEGPFDA